MWFQHRTLVFRMILCTYVPLQAWDFYDFYQVALRVSAYAHHAVLLEFLLELVVELIAVAMAFLNICLFYTSSSIRHSKARLRRLY